MRDKTKAIWGGAIIAMIAIALIFAFALKESNESLKEADEVLAHADYFISEYEERSKEYEYHQTAQETEEVSVEEQTPVEDESVAQLAEVYVNELVETYCDPLEVEYESNGSVTDEEYW